MLITLLLPRLKRPSSQGQFKTLVAATPKARYQKQKYAVVTKPQPEGTTRRHGCDL